MTPMLWILVALAALLAICWTLIAAGDTPLIVTRAALWEIRLAVEAVLDQMADRPCSLIEAVDAVCDRHGLADPRDRTIVEQGVIRRLPPAERAA